MSPMYIEMFRFAPQRRQPYKIFAFGGGKSLRLDLGKPQKVEDKLAYKILAECSEYIRESAKQKRTKPKTPPKQVKQVADANITTS